MDKASNHHDGNKRDMQVKFLTTIGVVVGIYVLFTYLIPFARFQFQRIRTKREILQRLENDTSVSSSNKDSSELKNGAEDSSSKEASDNSHKVKKIVPPNFRVSKDKFVSKPTVPTVAPSSGGTSTGTSSNPPTKARVPSRPSISPDFAAPTSGFLPQFSNLPDALPPIVTPASLQQQRLDESRRRLIEQQNREYELSVAKERENQRLLEEQQRVLAAKEARRQQIIDSVRPEPDSTCTAEDCLVFAFRAKQLSLKAEDLNKPFKSTRRFLKSHTWNDVIHYVQSLELRPMETPFAITANATVKSFKIEWEGFDASYDHDRDHDAAHDHDRDHDAAMREQPLAASGIPSNTVLWIHYH